MDLTKLVYRISEEFPTEEKYGLKSQMCRCAVSITSNIAEGSGRGSDKEFQRFLNMALASSYELETPFILTQELCFFTEERVQTALEKITEVQKMIYSFRETLAS